MAIKMKSRHAVGIWEGQQDNAGRQPVRPERARQGLTPERRRNPVGLRHQEIRHGDGDQTGACPSGPEAAGCGPG